MRKPRKALEEIPTPSEEELIARLQQMNPKYSSYACFLYLFGSRVSEAIGWNKKTIIGRYPYTHPRTLKDYEQPRYHYEVGKDKKVYPGLKKGDIQYNGDWLRIAELPTLKRRGDYFKNTRAAYVYINGVNEEPFVKILMDYVNTRPPLQPIWKYGRITAWRRIREGLGIPPHKLRGMRATKDAVTYDLDAIDLKRKFNWATDGMPMHYAAKNPRDIMEKISRAKQ